jgi:hypothetical protein
LPGVDNGPCEALLKDPAAASTNSGSSVGRKLLGVRGTSAIARPGYSNPDVDLVLVRGRFKAHLAKNAAQDAPGPSANGIRRRLARVLVVGAFVWEHTPEFTSQLDTVHR